MIIDHYTVVNRQTSQLGKISIGMDPDPGDDPIHFIILPAARPHPEELPLFLYGADGIARHELHALFAIIAVQEHLKVGREDVFSDGIIAEYHGDRPTLHGQRRRNFGADKTFPKH